jgi:hypothetical protein
MKWSWPKQLLWEEKATKNARSNLENEKTLLEEGFTDFPNVTDYSDFSDEEDGYFVESDFDIPWEKNLGGRSHFACLFPSPNWHLFVCINWLACCRTAGKSEKSEVKKWKWMLQKKQAVQNDRG